MFKIFQSMLYDVDRAGKRRKTTSMELKDGKKN